MRMLVIGLTGGIGSGKSTVARLFAKHVVPVIDADEIAHELTQPQQSAYTQILAHFGQAILLADDSLDRAKLRKIIFTRPDERQWLEALLHPLIRDEIKQRIAPLSAPYCILVIPLLLETTPYPFIDRILVVDAAENQQIQRTQSRDHLSRSEIEAILKTQVDRQQRLTKAHDVIRNEGELAALIPQVEKLHEFYLSLRESAE